MSKPTPPPASNYVSDVDDWPTELYPVTSASAELQGVIVQKGLVKRMPEKVPCQSPFIRGIDQESKSGTDSLVARFGAFPRIKLDAGHFFKDTINLGQEFQGIIVDVTPMRVIRSSNERDSEVIWTYDGVTTTSGAAVMDVLAGWIQQGHNPVIKETAEVLVFFTSEQPELAFQLVTLSLPQESTSRLAAYGTTCRFRGTTIEGCVTRFKVDSPIRTGGNTWTPWKFEFVGKLSPEDFATVQEQI